MPLKSWLPPLDLGTATDTEQPSKKFLKYCHGIHALAASSYSKSFSKTNSFPKSSSSWWVPPSGRWYVAKTSASPLKRKLLPQFASPTKQTFRFFKRPARRAPRTSYCSCPSKLFRWRRSFMRS